MLEGNTLVTRSKNVLKPLNAGSVFALRVMFVEDYLFLVTLGKPPFSLGGENSAGYKHSENYSEDLHFLHNIVIQIKNSNGNCYSFVALDQTFY